VDSYVSQAVNACTHANSAGASALGQVSPLDASAGAGAGTVTGSGLMWVPPAGATCTRVGACASTSTSTGTSTTSRVPGTVTVCLVADLGGFVEAGMEDEER